MLRTLDPHTSFLPPTAYSSMREKQQASFYGLGILVGVRNGRLTVIAPIDGTPASRLGIRAGDVIQRIEDEPTDKLSIDEAVSRLKGPKGTQVRITILRAGLEEPLELTVTRAEIPQTTVRYAYMIAPDTGYISISDFTRSTSSEVEKALAKLQGGGDEAAAARPAQQRRRTPRPGGRRRRPVPAGGLDGRRHPRAHAGFRPVLRRRRQPRADRRAGGRPGQQRHRVGRRDPLGRDPGPRHRAGGRHADLGQGSRADGLRPLLRRRSGAHHREVLHPVRAPDPARLQLLLRLLHRATASSPATTIPHVKVEPPATEAYSTDLGRKVYGGGGITPDVEVEPTEFAPFLQFLLARAAFFDFGVEYERRHPEITRDWRPDDDVLAEFRKWVVAQKIDTVEDLDKGFENEAERNYALRQIRAEIFASRFGIEASHQVQSEGDAQIQAALGLFPRAEALLAERLRLGKKPHVAASNIARP